MKMEKNGSNTSSSRVRSYTLQCTECSATSIARWSAMHSGGGAAQQQLSNSNNDSSKSGKAPAAKIDSSSSSSSSFNQNTNFYTRPFTPTVDVRFRKCGLCRTWGHFEAECPLQTSHHRLRFARAIIKGKRAAAASSLGLSSTTSLLSFEETAKSVPTTKNANMSIDLIVETENKVDEEQAIGDEVFVEKCGGFLIEQRKEPRVNDDSARVRNTTKKRKREEFIRRDQEDVTNVDGLLIKATSTRPIAIRNEAEPLMEGDLVTWSDESSSTGNTKVLVGVIVSRQENGINAKVRCLCVIPHEPGVGCISHVPVQRLQLVHNLNDNAEAAIASSLSSCVSHPTLSKEIEKRDSTWVEMAV
jgi:hypothetical protein